MPATISRATLNAPGHHPASPSSVFARAKEQRRPIEERGSSAQLGAVFTSSLERFIVFKTNPSRCKQCQRRQYTHTENKNKNKSSGGTRGQALGSGLSHTHRAAKFVKKSALNPHSEGSQRDESARGLLSVRQSGRGLVGSSGGAGGGGGGGGGGMREEKEEGEGAAIATLAHWLPGCLADWVASGRRAAGPLPPSRCRRTSRSPHAAQ